LVEYRRVLFLDGDVIPTRNLDFLFELSDGENAILKENLVVAGKLEPANAGFFMVAPKKGALEEINSIIQEQEVKARSLPYPYFDPVEGWGHVIQPEDQWETIGRSKGTNTKWTFWSAFSDQGLLYFWTRVSLHPRENSVVADVYYDLTRFFRFRLVCSLTKVRQEECIHTQS
jgi:hypothetical protein